MQKENEGSSDQPTARDAIAQPYFTRGVPVLDPPKAATEYMTYLSGSDLKRARSLLENLRDSKVGLSEVLLAIASLAWGGFLGALPAGVTDPTMQILFFRIVPLVGAISAIWYFFQRRDEAASTRHVALELLDRLPDLQNFPGFSAGRNLQISVQSDSASSSAPSDQVTEKDGTLKEKSSGTRKPLSDIAEDAIGIEYAVALMDDDIDRIRKIEEHQEKRSQVEPPVFGLRWRGEQIMWKLIYAESGSFHSLIELVDESKNDFVLCDYLAITYRWSAEHELSAKWFKLAADGAPSKLDKLRFLGESAKQLAEAGAREEAFAMCGAMADVLPVTSAELKLQASNVAEVIGKFSEKDLEVALQEYQLELDPADHQLRFSVAYAHSNLDRNDLAALHYGLIPYKKRSGITWNNFGVAWNQMGLTSKAVEAFEKAIGKGETLAASNLANVMIDAGLHGRAAQVMADSLKIEHDIRLDHSVIRLDEAKKRDEERSTELLKETPQRVKFFKNLGRAALGKQLSLSGTYGDDKYEVSFVIEHGSIKGTGHRRLSPFATALDSNGLPTPQQEFTVSGSIFGRAVRAKFTYPVSKSISLLLNENHNVSVLMILEENNDVLELLEILSPKVMSLRYFHRRGD